MARRRDPVLLFTAADVPAQLSPAKALPASMEKTVFAAFCADHVNKHPGQRIVALGDKRKPAYRALHWAEQVVLALPRAAVTLLRHGRDLNKGKALWVAAEQLYVELYTRGHTLQWHAKRWRERKLMVMSLQQVLAHKDGVREDADGLLLHSRTAEGGAGSYTFVGSRRALEQQSRWLLDPQCWDPQWEELSDIDLWVVQHGKLARNANLYEHVLLDGTPYLEAVEQPDREPPKKVTINWPAMQLPRPNKRSIKPGERAFVCGWEEHEPSSGMLLDFGDTPDHP